ncbi:MCP four helix bundle domain-containing protein [Cupriavidus basilensis]
MNITQRLLATLSLALFAILALGIGGIWQLRASQERFSFFNDNTLVSVRTLDDLWANVNGMRVSLYAYALSDEASGRADALAALAKADHAFDTIVATYERSDISDEKDRALLDADRVAVKAIPGGAGAFPGEICGGRRRDGAGHADGWLALQGGDGAGHGHQRTRCLQRHLGQAGGRAQPQGV